MSRSIQWYTKKSGFARKVWEQGAFESFTCFFSRIIILPYRSQQMVPQTMEYEVEHSRICLEAYKGELDCSALVERSVLWYICSVVDERRQFSDGTKKIRRCASLANQKSTLSHSQEAASEITHLQQQSKTMGKREACRAGIMGSHRPFSSHSPPTRKSLKINFWFCKDAYQAQNSVFAVFLFVDSITHMHEDQLSEALVTWNSVPRPQSAMA